VWNETSSRSASVQFYLKTATAPSTDKNYQTAVRQYEAYCDFRDWNPHEQITKMRAEEWLAYLGDRGSLSINTIKVYRAALGNYHHQRSTAPNPFATERCALILAGIERAGAEREQVRVAEQQRTAPITMDLIRAIRKEIKRDKDDNTLMSFAAAALATAHALRPSEMLGSAASPDRRLQLNQIVFYRDAEGHHRADIKQTGSGYVPDHCTVTLKISKTNQQGRPEVLQVASPVAVKALWQWLRKRGTKAGNFFQRSGKAPLSLNSLLKFLGATLASMGQYPYLTGRCFRIGGASSLNDQGGTEEEFGILGRWRTPQMWMRYVAPSSKKQRELLLMRRL
jgi:hypothetical protein